MSENFWSDRRVLVTGATGFIGSWLTENLVAKNADVSIFVRKDAFGLDAVKHLQKKVKIFYGDVTDRSTISPAFRDQEIILHLAAYTQVLHSIDNPAATFAINTSGTLNLLEEARKNTGNQTFIFASTDKVYGEPEYLPIDEKHKLNAKSPYDASKLAADRLVFSFFASYGINAAISRWSNTIGGRDANKLRAVPDFVTSLLNNKQPVIRRTGEDIRDYMYVTDAVRGIQILAENIAQTRGQAYNFGTERPTKLIDLLKLIMRTANKDVQPIIMGKNIPGEIDKQYLSAKKARDELGWRPQVSLEDAINLAVKWYQENIWWQQVMDRVAQNV